MKRIIAMLLAGATIALAGYAWIGGNDNVSHARATAPIVGGAETTPHQFPWTVGITINGSGFCGGVIISNEWVLTAGNCIVGASSWEVVAGAHDRSINEGAQVRQVSNNAILHESYNEQTIQNNIGLIRLSQPLSFNQNIQAINLDDSGNNWAGQVATMAGWGRSSDANFSISPTLRSVANPIITNAECTNVYGSTFVTSGVGCFSGAGGRGSCNGDGGGPVFIGNTLVGIMSFGSSAACDAGYPTGFTRIAEYRQWIQSNSGI